MSLLQILLGDQLGNLSQMLTENAGFTQPKADEFVPEVAKGFLHAFQEKSEHIDFSNIAGSASLLLEQFNIHGLAEKIGLSEQQVQAGIGMIMPTLLGLAEQHKEKLGGLESLISNVQNSPLSGALSGLGSTLFGK